MRYIVCTISRVSSLDIIVLAILILLLGVTMAEKLQKLNKNYKKV